MGATIGGRAIYVTAYVSSRIFTTAYLEAIVGNIIRGIFDPTPSDTIVTDLRPTGRELQVMRQHPNRDPDLVIKIDTVGVDDVGPVALRGLAVGALNASPVTKLTSCVITINRNVIVTWQRT